MQCLVHSAASFVIAIATLSPAPIGSQQLVSAGQTYAPAPAAAQALCARSIQDQANPNACLQATSVPTPGMLFPPPHDGGILTVSTGSSSYVGGGYSNQATGGASTISGGMFHLASALYATIGGGFGNDAVGQSSAVAGGINNNAGAQGATVGGGTTNFATGSQSTISGGIGNTASATQATIGGGTSNVAGGESATVSGGGANQAWGTSATVCGGSANLAPGFAATVCGGLDNQAVEAYSFAAGRSARANHFGSFVWADGSSSGGSSSADNEFNVFASGGTRIFSNSAGSTGVMLAPGAGSWSTVSDRDKKRNVAPIDTSEVLERVAALPISTWNYDAQSASIRHMGPMAQDFHAAFGLGASDKLIDTVDIDGVALAAIQGLNAKVTEQGAEIVRLHVELQRLAELVGSLAIARPAATDDAISNQNVPSR